MTKSYEGSFAGDSESKNGGVYLLDYWEHALALEQMGELARAVEAMQVVVDYLRDAGHPKLDQYEAHIDALRARLPHMR